MNKFVILSICLLVGLSGCTSLNQTNLEYSQTDVQEVIEVDNHKYAFDIEIDLVDDKNNAYFIDTEKNVDVFKEDEEESIDESEEDEDTIDPNIPFQAGRFEWWWIVVIVGTIALIFFIAWLVFFIWDRKDKKKYKKKQ